MKIIISAFFLLLVNIVNGQQYVFEGDITSPDSSGYYKINLSREVYNQLNKKRSDIRIYDQKGKEVSYIWKEEAFSHTDSAELLKINEVKFKQQNFTSPQKSIIRIKLNRLERVNKVDFLVKGPIHYRRFGTFSYKDLDKPSRKRKKYKKEFISVELSSEDTLSIEIPEARVKHLILEIENEDNAPLEVQNVILWQSNHYLIAYLEKEGSYKIKFGNNSALSPNYDLEYFRSKLPKKLAKAEVKNVVRLEKELEQQPFYQNRIFIWSIIIIVVLGLGIISIRMVKEIGKSSPAEK